MREFAVKKGKPSSQVEPEHASEAIERLFGDRLGYPAFMVRDLLEALWPLGPEVARQRAQLFLRVAEEGMKRIARPLSLEGLRELGVDGADGCPPWFMDLPVSVAVFASLRAENLIGAFVERAARPWAAEEGCVWCKAKAKGKVSRSRNRAGPPGRD